MNQRPRTPDETYGPALQKAEKEFCQLDPWQAAIRAAVAFEAQSPSAGVFQVPYFGQLFHIEWPQASVQRANEQRKVDIATRILLLHDLLTADGTPMADQWIAFRNLPGGLGYDAAFRGRASMRLSHAFGTELSTFVDVATAHGGERLTFGDASFLFRALPRVWLAVVVHLADDEFPAEANVLFDGAASHYLPTEDLAVLGGMLAGQLVKAAKAR